MPCYDELLAEHQEVGAHSCADIVPDDVKQGPHIPDPPPHLQETAWEAGQLVDAPGQRVLLSNGLETSYSHLCQRVQHDITNGPNTMPNATGHSD